MNRLMEQKSKRRRNTKPGRRNSTTHLVMQATTRRKNRYQYRCIGEASFKPKSAG